MLNHIYIEDKPQGPFPWTHEPTDRQRGALAIGAKHLLVGGGAGTGKTQFLLMRASMYANYPHYRCLIVRKHFKDLAASGNLLDQARLWWPGMVKNIPGQTTVNFPSGANILFSHLAHKGAENQHLGGQYHTIIVDEAGEIQPEQIAMIMSRMRRKVGDQIPTQLVMASNPIGPSREWLRDEFVDSDDLDKDYINFRLEHNPHLDVEDYRKTLDELPPQLKKRLLHGDWWSDDNAGFFEGLEKVPVLHEIRGEPTHSVRAWDLAATKGGGDYTVGAKVSLIDGEYVLENIVRGQWSTGDRDQRILATARADTPSTLVEIEEEGGSAGKSQTRDIRRMLGAEFRTHKTKPTGDKATRAYGLATAIYNGLFKIRQAKWNRDWKNELFSFNGPDMVHDDQVDATAAAVNLLSRAARQPKESMVLV